MTLQKKKKQKQKTVSIQPAIQPSMPETEKKGCAGCDGVCACSEPKKPSGRKLSDEMPKAKNPRIKRKAYGSENTESPVEEGDN